MLHELGSRFSTLLTRISGPVSEKPEQVYFNNRNKLDTLRKRLVPVATAVSLGLAGAVAVQIALARGYQNGDNHIIPSQTAITENLKDHFDSESSVVFPLTNELDINRAGANSRQLSGETPVISDSATIFENNQFAQEIHNSSSVADSPAKIEGSVLDAWLDRYSCGSQGTWPETFSYIRYQGGVVATQTHILWTTEWARGFRHIDNLNAPPNYIITWGSGSGINQNYPVPALPDYWTVTQEASDNTTGSQLLNQSFLLECPYIQPDRTIVGIPAVFTLTEANASVFGLQIEGNEPVTNTSGIFSHTFPNTGNAILTATAYGLGTSVSRVLTAEITNTAPIASAGPDQFVKPNSSVTLDGSGSHDPDGHQIFYGWSQTGGTPVILRDYTISRPVFLAFQKGGLLTFTLTVTDAHGLPNSDETIVNTAYETYLPNILRSSR